MASQQTNYRIYTAQPAEKPETAGSGGYAMPNNTQDSESLGSSVLSIALIGPDEPRRRAVAAALGGSQAAVTREFTSYPPNLDDVPRLLEQHYDVVIVDLDSDPEYALDLVESICTNGTATAMVYSAQADAELLVRCMRAGAREFLTLPMSPGAMDEALVRASVRRPAVRTSKKTAGRLLVFLGAKGGSGVTTLATNFAVSLATESGKGTLLIDLDLPLGDAALGLGMTAQYSTVNALQNSSRLDSTFLATLLTKHNSGLNVLAAPGKFAQTPVASNEEVDKLLSVALMDFDYVVVDAGSRLDLAGTALFAESSTVYLVTQVGIAELRNSNRLVSEFFTAGGPKLEIVLNRYSSRTLGVDEEHITKALTRPAQWKVPNDYATIRETQNTATPFAQGNTAIARAIQLMARSVCGVDKAPEKKKGFKFFG
jgi:pilus assembly protein CpaE